MTRKEELWFLIRRSMLCGTKPRFILDNMDHDETGSIVIENWTIDGAGFQAELTTKETPMVLYQKFDSFEDADWILEDMESFFSFTRLKTIMIERESTDDAE